MEHAGQLARSAGEASVVRIRAPGGRYQVQEQEVHEAEVSHRWAPIEDLPEDWEELCREDLHAVHEQWVSDRRLIRDEQKIRKFQEELALHWAIETGLIERLYTADRGITVQIAKAGMEALGQFHARGKISWDARALITDQREALEMVMDVVGGRRDLTTSYLKELHQRLTLSQERCEALDQFGNSVQVDLLKGQWKRQPNNPKRPDGSIHEYCPPEFVQEELERLFDWHRVHEERLRDAPEVLAAWLHHRFAEEGVEIETNAFDDEGRETWWYHQIVETAKKHEYFAQLDQPRRWTSLQLGLPERRAADARLVISFHAVGRAAELHAATAFLTGKAEGGDGSSGWWTNVVSDKPFNFGFAGSGGFVRDDRAARAKREERFREWLERVVEAGVSKWGGRF